MTNVNDHTQDLALGLSPGYQSDQTVFHLAIFVWRNQSVDIHGWMDYFAYAFFDSDAGL